MIVSAPLIHNGIHFLPTGSSVEVNEAGVIIQIYYHCNFPDIEYYEGTICPGFINAHCHLELSHLKGQIKEKTGLVAFLEKVISIRNNFSDEQKKSARLDSFLQMKNNGIIAVGDICNTTDTLDLCAMNQMHIHSFIELTGFNPDFSEKNLTDGLNKLTAFKNIQARNNCLLNQTITPHAAYSVSEKLFGLISSLKSDALLSIHNQETKDEDLLFKSNTGGLLQLYNYLNIDYSAFIPSNKSSIQTYSEWLAKNHKMLFVHNTFSSKEDILFATNYFESCIWCLCPNANLFIEDSLPEINEIVKHTKNICIGTDSLASNSQLCVYNEIKTINTFFPAIGWETLLRWACYNGAVALGFENQIGVLKTGFIPGLVQIINHEIKKIV